MEDRIALNYGQLTLQVVALQKEIEALKMTQATYEAKETKKKVKRK